jgi:hypothetical protein
MITLQQKTTVGRRTTALLAAAMPAASQPVGFQAGLRAGGAMGCHRARRLPMPRHSGLLSGFHAYRCGGSAGLFTGFPFKPVEGHQSPESARSVA